MQHCDWCEYFKFRRIMNFTPLVVVMVGRNRLETYATPRFTKSSRLRFCENMRISDFREPQNLKAQSHKTAKPQSHIATKPQSRKAAEP